jgi:hypothetical protein
MYLYSSINFCQKGGRSSGSNRGSGLEIEMWFFEVVGLPDDRWQRRLIDAD